MAKRNKVSVSIKGEVAEDIKFIEANRDDKYRQGFSKDESEVEELVKPGTIYSRLDHQITLTYEGQAMCIPPRGVREVANVDKIGALPKGIQVVLKKIL